MRWMRCGCGALLGVLALLLLATPASGSLDEWSPADIRQFFLDHADCDIAVERIVDSGLIVDDLFDGRLDHEVLEKDLGVSSHIQRKRALEAVRVLDKKLTNAPGNFYEWRYANRRLCDFWLLPLSNAPKMLLLWLRYTDHDDPTGILEELDNVVDQTTFIDFWLTWTFVPSLPQFQLARQLQVAGMADTVIYLVAGSRVLLELLTATAVVMSGSVNLLFVTLRGELWLYTYSLFSFYVFWWFWPSFLLDLLFYSTIYIFMPFKIVYAARSSVGAIRKLWE